MLRKLKRFFGVGPIFIMAEPGTNPLDEPESFIYRRKSQAGTWLMIALLMIALAGVGIWLWRAYGAAA